jgi:NifU-like protein involved in Fe-S cluster formation
MDALYSKTLLRIAADAEGAGRLSHPDGTGHAASAVCGDRITLDVQLNGSALVEIGHDTKACLLAQASSALLAGAAHGLAMTDALAGQKIIAEYLTQDAPLPAEFADWAVFEALKPHPARHACVLLPFRALTDALENHKIALSPPDNR